MDSLLGDNAHDYDHEEYEEDILPGLEDDADEYFKRYDRDGDGKFGANEIAAMDRRKKKEEL